MGFIARPIFAGVQSGWNHIANKIHKDYMDEVQQEAANFDEDSLKNSSGVTLDLFSSRIT